MVKTTDLGGEVGLLRWWNKNENDSPVGVHYRCIVSLLFFVTGRRRTPRPRQARRIPRSAAPMPNNRGAPDTYVSLGILRQDTISFSVYLDESHKQLEALNEKRPGVVQMVKLANKEREILETVKNEAEDYMLKELSLLKWQEKAVKFASEDNAAKMEETKKTASGLQENITAER
ncbi:structural maintenance of chromosome 3 [Artemisia annua]|uniref:Structural maintenance of chromosome 3 n=1 Tax=Artemisia annua TaxID=35608 RepID=A0A2U1LJU0_ARTAN|nr:structural maintenance of chromosome 3 [Artemisia annua]